VIAARGECTSVSNSAIPPRVLSLRKGGGGSHACDRALFYRFRQLAHQAITMAVPRVNVYARNENDDEHSTSCRCRDNVEELGLLECYSLSLPNIVSRVP